MFCIQEAESHSDPFANMETDPLNSGNTQSESSDEEPASKRHKSSTAYSSPSLNLKVYKIPAFSTSNNLSIYPAATPTTSLPKFVNNPMNLANPLSLTTKQIQTSSNNIVKNLQTRFSLPSKLVITTVNKSPPSNHKIACDTGEAVRYKKNGEVAKKRGPPKGYKRKPKSDLSQSLNENHLTMAQNVLLSNLLAAANTTLSPASVCDDGDDTPSFIPHFEPPQDIIVPEGAEHVQLELDPQDWFPSEPYKMVFSKKKNPKWKNFPYQCEHCFKGYRVASTLLMHSSERHGCAPKDMALPCPCCPHVSHRRKEHKRHLTTHEGRKHRIFCYYCIPPPNPEEPYEKESIKYAHDKYPQYWFASEESLRLHKKRKHPYAAMFNYNWYCTWGDESPNS